ncbi:Electron transport complex subunit RsxG [bioreactor metagenome]|uniref:Electron transport complex subunit RsxG n=1 Tax=bioreactor metagenome TaxID=1076179 RepID=A0A644YDA0_9ZZZZ
MKKGLIIVLVFVLSFGFLQVATNLTSQGETLTATAKGFGGDVTVTLIVDGDDIVSVTAVGASETQGIGSNAIDQLPALIADADSADVDGVSGATITSNAIKTAVRAALGIESAEEPAAPAEPTKETSAKPAEPAPEGALTATAKGFGGDVTVTVVVEGDDIVSVTAVGADETPGIGSNALEQLPGKIAEADSTDVDGVSGATYTSDAIKKAVEEALASKGAAAPAAEGALTGTAKGFGGDVTVTVTVDGDDILTVEAVGADETPGIGSNAIEQLPAKIVEADSTEVEVISGATYTSKAIIEAVNAALAAQ